MPRARHTAASPLTSEQAPASKAPAFYPDCGRTGDDLGKCGRGATPCPDPRPADPATTITIGCDACQFKRVVALKTITAGAHAQEFRGLCKHSDCQARVLR